MVFYNLISDNWCCNRELSKSLTNKKKCVPFREFFHGDDSEVVNERMELISGAKF